MKKIPQESERIKWCIMRVQKGSGILQWFFTCLLLRRVINSQENSTRSLHTGKVYMESGSIPARRGKGCMYAIQEHSVSRPGVWCAG